tara:strand:- start:5447 stop:6931 length:1485 start_codon:yes stop_codon:yes gene_type:complete
MSVILYEYKEFEGVYDELVNIPKLENIVMNNTYVKKYNSNPMPSSMKYNFEGVLGRLLWYMYVANRVAYSLQYQENEDIFTPEETAEKYTIEEAKQKFASFMYNIYTNNGTVFLSKDWIGLAQDINYFLKYKMEAGGTLPTPFGQAGLVGETGAMNEMDMFAMGGGLPQGVHQYYAQTYNPAYPTPHGYAKGGELKSIMSKKDIGVVIPKTYQIGDKEFGNTYKVERVNTKKYSDNDKNRHYNFRIWEYDKSLDLFDEIKSPSGKLKALERIEMSKDYAKGGKTQGYNDRLDESLGNRNSVEPLMMQSYKDRRDESKGMEKSMGRRAYQSVGTMDKMAKGGEVADINKFKKQLIAKAKRKGLYENFGQAEVRKLEDKYGYSNNVIEFDNWAMNFDLSQMAKGGETQGYNDKLDESLGNTKGKRSTKEQNYKDRRNESEAMEKKGGKRKYARVKTMDKGNRKKRQTPMSLAKEIRKEGEKWQDAVKRASAMLKKK